MKHLKKAVSSYKKTKAPKAPMTYKAAGAKVVESRVGRRNMKRADA